MRKFMINVNGKSYEVEVEEIRDGVPTMPAASSPPATAAPHPTQQAAPVSQPATPAAQPEPVAQSQPAPTAPEKAGFVQVKAPMPGTILDIRIQAGDGIKKGQVVLILEAMKMENEIMAPQDGIISSIHTSKGTSVNSGDLLFTMN